MPFWASQDSLHFFQWVARAAVAYFWLLLMAKLMGPREVGQSTLFDFVVAISIGSIAGGVLSNPRDALVGPLITMATFALLDVGLAYISLKNSKIRRIVEGEPVILVKDGRLLDGSMTNNRFNLDDLMEGIRQKNVTNLNDVEFAILEPNGRVSVVPKSQARPLRPSDLGIPTSYEGFPTMVIEDGNILDDNLRELHLDREWLFGKLREQGIDDHNSVLAAMLDTQGRFFASKRFED